MAARVTLFKRELKLATADLEPDAINKALAAFARRSLAHVLSAGASPSYDRIVNGRIGAAEESVQAPGPIVYEFSNWRLVVNAALDELKARSPRRSGRYQSSFLVIVGGRTVVTDFSKIRANAEVIILNAQPYTRKIEVGAMRMSVPEQHFEFARGALSRRFGKAFRIERKFVNVPEGIHPLMPYRLKGRRSRDKISRRDGLLSYPALVLNPVT